MTEAKDAVLFAFRPEQPFPTQKLSLPGGLCKMCCTDSVCLMLANDRRLYSVDVHSFSPTDIRLAFTLHPFFADKTVLDIACSNHACYVVVRGATESHRNNELFSWNAVHMDMPSTIDIEGESVEKVFAAHDVAFAVCTSGNVYSWGQASEGQLGFASIESFVKKPRQIKSLSKFGGTVVRIAACEEAAMALLSNGKCVQWGHLKSIKNFPPHVVETLANINAVDARAADSHFLVLTSEGHLFTWGKERASGKEEWTPKRVDTFGASMKAADIDCVGDSNFAIVRDGGMYVWGLNVPRMIAGQLKASAEDIPVRVPMLADRLVKCMFVGRPLVVCELEPTEEDVDLFASQKVLDLPYMDDSFDGNSSAGSQPVSPDGTGSIPRLALQSKPFIVRPLSSGGDGLNKTASSQERLRHLVHMFGTVGESPNKKIFGKEATAANSNQEIWELEPSTIARSVSIGLSHAGLVLQNGSLTMWGSNDHGQCSCLNSSPVNMPTDVLSVTCGGMHTLALDRGGIVYACGYSANGECASSATAVATFTAVEFPTTERRITKISAGWNHSLALCDDGNVYAWGLSKFGQLGVGAEAKGESSVCVPRRIDFFAKNNTRVVDIAAGRNHSLFLSDAGEVFACGSNSNGQIGMSPDEKKEVDEPFRIPALFGRHVISIAAGSSHCLALDALGRVFAWGSGNSGRLGSGDSKDRFVPVVVSGLEDTKISSIFAGCTSYHSIAVSQYGALYVWGATPAISKPVKSAHTVLTGKRITLAYGGQKMMLAIESVGGYVGAVGVPHSARLALMDREYHVAEQELISLRQAQENMSKEYTELMHKYRRMCAEDLRSLPVSDLDQLERIYLEGIDKIARTRQDLLLSELQDKMDRMRKAAEAKYKALMDAIQQRDEAARKETEEQKVLEMEMKLELKQLRSDMEHALSALEDKELVDREKAQLDEAVVELEGDVAILEEECRRLNALADHVAKENRERKDQLRFTQEDFVKMQEELAALRKQKAFEETASSIERETFRQRVQTWLAKSDEQWAKDTERVFLDSVARKHMQMILNVRLARRKKEALLRSTAR